VLQKISKLDNIFASFKKMHENTDRYFSTKISVNKHYDTTANSNIRIGAREINN